MMPNLGIRALTLLSLFQWTDTFRSRDFASLPLFRCATSRSQQLRILPSKRDIETSFLPSTEPWSFRHPIEPPDGSRVEFRDQLAHAARHRQLRRVSRVQDTTIWPRQRQKSHTINLIEFEYNSYEYLEHHHQLEMLQWTEWSYPWMDTTENQRRSRETIYESAQLRLHSF